MQRRQFSFSAATVAAASTVGMALPALAQIKPIEGETEFLTLDVPAPLVAPAGKIEVVEFFWYKCPHCNAFEPTFNAWAKKLPKDVFLRRVPVGFRADFEPQQRLFFVLEALNKLDELHAKVFHTIHVEKLPLNTFEELLAWAEKQGIAKDRFAELYKSFAITSKVRKATQLQEAYAVDGVPSLGIHGRYFTSATQAGNLQRALQVTDALIAQWRSKAK
ncbi:MAG: thiol:disulfide interchange protein DsbA/DsbL [Polaromonas sp.]|nr:thiol:disulfide interchange protein DsbA/DsbL [Polaromonas sp.]